MKAPFIGLHIFVSCSCSLGLKVIRGWIVFLCNAFHFVDLVSDCCVEKKNLWWSRDNRHWMVFNSNIICYIKSKHSHLNFRKYLKHGSSVFIQYLFLFKTSLIWATVPCMHAYSHNYFFFPYDVPFYLLEPSASFRPKLKLLFFNILFSIF